MMKQGEMMKLMTRLVSALAVCMLAAAAGAQPAKPAAKGAAGTARATIEKLYTGDLDGMIKRRLIRILVPYSKTYYFVDRANQRGLAYDVSRTMEDDLNKTLKSKHVRVHVVLVPVKREEFIAALKEGRGDIALANITITPARAAQVDFTAPARKGVAEVVVTAPGAAPVATPEELSGREVFITKSSSFHDSLETLNAELKKKSKPPVKIRLAPENLEVEDILEMVNAGLAEATVADDFVAVLWKYAFPKLQINAGAAVRSGAETGWMLRKNSPQLKAALDRFLAKYPEGSATRNTLVKRYFGGPKAVKSATSAEEMKKFEATVELFRKYGGKYELDYLLVMAQGYQESRLNQSAKSHVGAIGVMQLMPATGKDMKVGDVAELEPNVHAGAKYMRFMIDQFYAKEPMSNLDKGLFTFASYNAGPGRVRSLRKEAEKRGLDPNVWFNNVELVAAEKIGRETVEYVSNIYKYYLAYKMLEEQRVAREQARGALPQPAAAPKPPAK
jgi:membrane-bound lytic murein transglycosylase MltF